MTYYGNIEKLDIPIEIMQKEMDIRDARLERWRSVPMENRAIVPNRRNVFE